MQANGAPASRQHEKYKKTMARKIERSYNHFAK